MQKRFPVPRSVRWSSDRSSPNGPPPPPSPTTRPPRPFVRPLTAVLFALAIAAGCDDRPTDRPSRRAGWPEGKTVVVVLDGGTWNAITPLLQAGELPHILQLMESGTYGPLLADPPFSPPSWTTLATGLTMAHHGVDNFVKRRFTHPEAGVYELVPIDATDVGPPRFWNITSDAGIPTGIMRWLFTWPPERIRGVLLSDHGGRAFDFLHDRPIDRELRAAYEPRLFIDADCRITRDPRAAHDPGTSPVPFRDRDRMVAEAVIDVDRAEQAYDYVRSHYPELELLTVAFFWGNQIQHEFTHYWLAPKVYGASEAEAARYGQVVPDLYRTLDDFVGRLQDDPEVGTIMIVSDHGMELIPLDFPTSIKAYHFQIRFDHLLEAFGYLHFKPQTPAERAAGAPLEVDVERSVARSVAYRRTESGITLLRKDRPPYGGILEGEEAARKARDAIARDLASIHFVDDGTPLFGQIGPPPDGAPWPDLVIGKYARLTYGEIPSLFPRLIQVGDEQVPCGRFVRFAGGHIRAEHGYDLNPEIPLGEEGIFLLSGPGVRSARRLESGVARTMDVTPTLLYLLGLPVSAEMDGRVITEALLPEMLRERPVERVDTYGDLEKRFVSESGEETRAYEETTLERLKTLGYVN